MMHDVSVLGQISTLTNSLKLSYEVCLYLLFEIFESHWYGSIFVDFKPLNHKFTYAISCEIWSLVVIHKIKFIKLHISMKYILVGKFWQPTKIDPNLVNQGNFSYMWRKFCLYAENEGEGVKYHLNWSYNYDFICFIGYYWG